MAEIEPSPPILRIKRPGDLLDAIPYLLGFHPRESVVLVGLRNRTVQVTARFDLEDLPPEEQAARTQQILSTLTRARVSEVVVAVFTADFAPLDAGVLPHGALVDDLAQALDENGIYLADALLAVRERWWSYVCTDPDCCPPMGMPLLGMSSEPAAAATYAGLVALADRETLERVLAPDPPAPSLSAAIDEAEDVATQAVLDDKLDTWRRSSTRALFAAARAVDRAAPAEEAAGQDGICRPPGAVVRIDVNEAKLARYGVALTDLSVRDSLWRAVDVGRIDGCSLWQRLATSLPTPYDAAPLFLFGWAAWRRGSGALAAIAAERALKSDPEYSAAELLSSILSHGLDPFHTPRLGRRSA